jgi:formylmethanofuran dehydrogenase subunit E
MSIRKQSGLKVIDEFKRVGRKVIGYQWVKVDMPRKLPLYPSEVCSQCKEPFLRAPGSPDRCAACQGEVYFEVLDELPPNPAPSKVG